MALNSARRWRSYIFDAVRALIGDRRGNIAAITALMLIPIIGALAMGTEAASWFTMNRAMQNAADSAALAAAANADGDSGTGYRSEARAVAAKYGLVDGANNTTVLPDYLNIAGLTACATNKCYIVTITKTMPLYFSQIVGFGGGQGQQIRVGAIAAPPRPGGICADILDPTGPKAVSITNGNTVLTQCNLQINSTDSDALDRTGGTLTAQAIDIAGTGNCNKGGACTGVSPAPQTGQPAVPDPYSSLYAQNNVSSTIQGACLQTGLTVNTAQTLPSGIYCNGVNLNCSGCTITLSGTYIVRGGTFKISNGTVTGTGVTIILTCQTPPCTGGSSNYANFSISNGTTTLNAPTTGEWSGILIYQDPNEPANKTTNSLDNGNNSLTGVLYFPTTTLKYTNGTGSSPCTQIVAYDLSITNGNLSSLGCNAAGVNNVAPTSLVLIQ